MKVYFYHGKHLYRYDLYMWQVIYNFILYNQSSYINKQQIFIFIGDATHFGK